MLEQRFGESPPWSVGVEEELFLLDRRTLRPAAAPEGLLDGARLKPELFRSLVELNTRVCAGAEEAVAELAELRAEAGARAAGAGLAIAAAGTLPLASPAEQEVVDDPELAAFAEYAGPSARVQYCCGLHVHVGMPDAATCMAALESALPWLPLVLALSANSPYFDGVETGLASTRAELLARLPRSGAPPAYGTYEAWEAAVLRLVELGLARDSRWVWWDVRPSPGFGTLELRMPDQPTTLEHAAAFVALLQALAADPEVGPPADRGLYQQNRWAALRFGREAKLVHPDGARLMDVPELTAELLARIGPAAGRLGSVHLLEPLERLARHSQAEAQLETGRAEGLEALTRRLVAETSAC